MKTLHGLLIWCACLLAAVVALWAQLVAVLIGDRGRAHRIAIGFDQTGNSALGGWPDETLSSRAYRTGSPLVDLLDRIFGEDHCMNAYHAERRRAQWPPEMRP